MHFTLAHVVLICLVSFAIAQAPTCASDGSDVATNGESITLYYIVFSQRPVILQTQLPLVLLERAQMMELAAASAVRPLPLETRVLAMAVTSPLTVGFVSTLKIASQRPVTWQIQRRAMELVPTTAREQAFAARLERSLPAQATKAL